MVNTLKIETQAVKSNNRKRKIKKKHIPFSGQNKIFSVYIRNRNTIYYNSSFDGETKLCLIK